MFVDLAAVFAAAALHACPAPELAVADFKAADDGKDRGYAGGVSIVDADADGDFDVMATRGYDVTASPYAAIIRSFS
jgi:hypothetical protein